MKRQNSEQLQQKETGFKEILDSGKEYYEIRLESIGGLGANLCGKMLGEMGIKYMDVNSSNFSSYGSEKTGTPVKGYVRYCKKEKEIRIHSPIVKPDLLVVFHEALLKDPSVLEGCDKNTKILIAMESDQGISEWIKKSTLSHNLLGEKTVYAGFSEIYGVEAQQIAMETHSRINVVMLGAILKIMGADSIESGEQICRETLGKKYPASLEGNLKGIRSGYEKVKKIKIEQEACENVPMTDKNEGDWGYLNAPMGGINPRLGNTVLSDLSPSRQGYIPLFIQERCVNCGLCFSTCPDMVFQFAKGTYKGKEMMINQGLDYYHCKGCLRCVDVCPVNALVRGVEKEVERKEFFLPNQELLRRPKYYEEAGADGYITSESYFTEQRMEGGEV